VLFMLLRFPIASPVIVVDQSEVELTHVRDDSG